MPGALECGIMIAPARREAGGNVTSAAQGHDRAKRRPSNSGDNACSGVPHARRHIATQSLFMAMVMVMLYGAGAGSLADAGAQGQVGGRGHRRLNRKSSRRARGKGKGPWRAVPVELKATPRDSRRQLGSTMAIPQTTQELPPSYKYGMTPHDGVIPATPDATTIPGTSTAAQPTTTFIEGGTPDANAGEPTSATTTAVAAATAAAAGAAAATEAAATTTAAADADAKAAATTTSLAAATSIEDAGAAGITISARSAEGTTEFGTTTTETATATVSGEFGMAADWREAISMPGGEGGGVSLRDEACLTEEKQADVKEILRRRNATPVESKVAACVRTKDFGRFLPEWMAFHYAIGVDEITVYDDDSVDDTKEVLQPFVDAGMVVYLFEEIGELKHEMRPLNHCLSSYVVRRKTDSSAPAWITFHDTDEYIFPVQTNVTISQAFMNHSATCCAHVPRVQYGTGGHVEMPRGLILETFLTHASPHNGFANRIPKVMVNLAPDDPSLGVVIPPLKSMHNAEGCICENIPVAEMRINHYLGSTEDYLKRMKRAWQDGYSQEKVERIVEQRDVNDHTSDTITAWGCATREVLARIVEGIDLEFGLD